MIDRFYKLKSSWHLEGAMRGIGVIFSANAVVAIFGLGTMVLTARALGPVGLGLLALIEAYGRVFDQVFRFEPSQAVIRYGSSALEDDDLPRLRRLIKFATFVDFGGALLAAGLAFLGIGLVGAWFGFSPEQEKLLTMFLIAMVFSVSATPIAVLRLLSRFGLYAKILVGLSVIRFSIAAALWYTGAELEWFLFLLIAYTIFEHLVPFVFAWHQLARRVGGQILTAPMNGVLAENAKILSFMFNANVNVLARNSTRQLDTVILGGIVNATEIGYYNIAKRIGVAALRVAKPVQFVIYPKLAQLWFQNEKPRLVALVGRLGLMLSIAGGLAVVLMWFFIDDVILIAFGEAFMPASPLLMLHIIAASIMLAGVTLNTALLSVGHDKKLVAVTLIATLVFFALLVPFANTFGVIAGSVLHVVFNVIWLTGCLYVFLTFSKTASPAAEARRPD